MRDITLLVSALILSIVCSRLSVAYAEKENSMQAKAHHLLILGDSLTDGYTLGKGAAYPVYLERLAKEAALPLQITNGGVSGDTTGDGLRRLPGFESRKPDTFMVALGTNDLFRSVPEERAQSNVGKILSMAKEMWPNAKLVVVGTAGAWDVPKDYEDRFHQGLRKVASKYKARYVPSLLQPIVGKREFFLPDGVHPNEKGHAMIAEGLFAALQEIVNS